MAERSAAGLGKAFGVPRIPRAQFVGGRVAQRGDIVGEKFHFLRQPALDDGVAPIEAEGERLAIQDLLANAAFDESVASPPASAACATAQSSRLRVAEDRPR